MKSKKNPQKPLYPFRLSPYNMVCPDTDLQPSGEDNTTLSSALTPALQPGTMRNPQIAAASLCPGKIGDKKLEE
ncbi:hypothetical protein HGM15179_011046 [Zosterops borbonicus]|uniref:Uncharacterized protein n=1 Tax=Zosterops borbonicus TaxID=364589 RepID=A0A8K1LJB1_9PASS|nr:hypothetical protein HGM15179_011046 [Zosterops borbonicus]